MLKKISLCFSALAIVLIGGSALASTLVTFGVPNGLNANAGYHDHTYIFKYCIDSQCQQTPQPLGSLYEDLMGNAPSGQGTVNNPSEFGTIYLWVQVVDGKIGSKSLNQGDISGTYISRSDFSVGPGNVLVFDVLDTPSAWVKQ